MRKTKKKKNPFYVARIRAKLKQSELCKITGLKQAYLSKLERGVSAIPNLKILNLYVDNNIIEKGKIKETREYYR